MFHSWRYRAQQPALFFIVADWLREHEGLRARTSRCHTQFALSRAGPRAVTSLLRGTRSGTCLISKAIKVETVRRLLEYGVDPHGRGCALLSAFSFPSPFHPCSRRWLASCRTRSLTSACSSAPLDSSEDLLARVASPDVAVFLVRECHFDVCAGASLPPLRCLWLSGLAVAVSSLPRSPLGLSLPSPPSSPPLPSPCAPSPTTAHRVPVSVCSSALSSLGAIPSREPLSSAVQHA